MDIIRAELATESMRIRNELINTAIRTAMTPTIRNTVNWLTIMIIEHRNRMKCSNPTP
jgi:hypothetical protein